VARIWDAGARGFLHKERALTQVELALASLMAGASWWDQKATAALQCSDPLQAIAASYPGKRLNGLTQRERKVLACLAAGDSIRAIAQRLGIGESTVRSHVHLLLQRLQVSNRTQAALFWRTTQLGRLSRPSPASNSNSSP
jgi:two-component system NarL family response regulator